MRDGLRERERERGGADSSGPPPFRGPAYKTKLCALWRGRGGCPRPNCGFAHGEAELRRPPPRASFAPRPRPGRRDFRDPDFRARPERRHSPRGRYSPESARGRSFRDRRQSSQERGSSHSRSPTRKSDRKRSESLDGGKTDSSESLRTSDNEDREKDFQPKKDREKDRQYSSSDEKNDSEEQMKKIHLDMEKLREDKAELEMVLEKKVEDAHKLASRIDDLELELNKVKEDYQRMTSKTKKLVKAHGRCMRAQEDLKRSQARFERLADLLASDILKPSTKEQGSRGNANEDVYNAYEMSPSDQRQNHRKRSIALSASEDEKTGKRRRESDDDMIPMPEKYRLEDALEPFNNSKGNGMPKSFPVQKKLGNGDQNEEGNIVSTSNLFTDRYKGEDEQVNVDL